MINYESIANAFIDDRCEACGVTDTIKFLINDFGLNKTDLLAMNFDESDIQDVTEPLIKQSGEMLGYIMELVNDEEELVEHVFPAMGYSHQEAKQIYEGLFDNENRLLETHDMLLNEIIEAVNDKDEIRGVLKNLGFSQYEISEIVAYL